MEGGGLALLERWASVEAPDSVTWQLRERGGDGG